MAIFTQQNLAVAGGNLSGNGIPMDLFAEKGQMSDARWGRLQSVSVELIVSNQTLGFAINTQPILFCRVRLVLPMILS